MGACGSASHTWKQEKEEEEMEGLKEDEAQPEETEEEEEMEGLKEDEAQTEETEEEEEMEGLKEEDRAESW